MKTPDERGPLGAWAYEARVRLGLSVEAVAAALPQPVNPATIRKAEGESRNMSRPLWRQLTAYYAKMGRERGVGIAQPPQYGDAPEPAGQTELVAAIRAQTDAINRLVGLVAELLARDPVAPEATTARLRDLASFAIADALGPRALELPESPPSSSDTPAPQRESSV